MIYETPTPETAGQSHPSSEPAHPPLHSTKFGNGKLANLPPELVDEVGLMLLDGIPQVEILRRLGDAGKHITEVNLTNWKQAGFKKWHLEFERRAALKESRENAIAILNTQPGDELYRAGTKIASAQLNELIQKFDPTNLHASLYEKPELYFRLIDAICRLNEGDAAATHQRAETRLVQAKLETDQSTAAPKIATRQDIKFVAQRANLI